MNKHRPGHGRQISCWKCVFLHESICIVASFSLKRVSCSILNFLTFSSPLFVPPPRRFLCSLRNRNISQYISSRAALPYHLNDFSYYFSVQSLFVKPSLCMKLELGPLLHPIPPPYDYHEALQISLKRRIPTYRAQRDLT